MFLLLPLFIVTNFVTIKTRNGFGQLEIDFVCLTSDSLTTDQYFVETLSNMIPSAVRLAEDSALSLTVYLLWGNRRQYGDET